MSGSRCEVSQLVSWYREFLDNGKSAAFVSCVSTRYNTATLIRLTRSTDSESRRAAVLALGMVGDQSALVPVGRRLRDADRCVRLVAEMAFADLCQRQQGDAVARQLIIARRHLDGGRPERAEQVLDRVVDVYPKCAEAWYLKARAKFLLHDFVVAIGYARRAMAVLPCHFSALTLEAKAWLELDSPSRALESFRRSFSINPSQTQVQSYIELLRRRAGTSD